MWRRLSASSGIAPRRAPTEKVDCWASGDVHNGPRLDSLTGVSNYLLCLFEGGRENEKCSHCTVKEPEVTLFYTNDDDDDDAHDDDATRRSKQQVPVYLNLDYSLAKVS